MNLYHSTGIFTGGYSLEERNAFIERHVLLYDLNHPGNTRPMKLKRKTARVAWRKYVERQLKRDQKAFESLIPTRVGDAS